MLIFDNSTEIIFPSKNFSLAQGFMLSKERANFVAKNILVPLVLFFSVTGVYLISFNSFDIYFMAIVALLSLVLRVLNYPMPPLILGFILGGMLEKNLRRAVLINDGSFFFFGKDQSV